MPKGFKNVRSPKSGVNTYNLGDNCYYCSVAALLNASAEELFKKVEIMQESGGTQADEIVALFSEADVTDITYTTFTGPQDVYEFIKKEFENGESVGLAYVRSDKTGHMVVATRDDDYVNNRVSEGIKCVDYQQSPPRVTDFPPETTITQYLVFYRS